MINFKDNIPLYIQVAEKLEDLIRNGGFPKSKLPTERELAILFKVSVITIKQSLNILSNKNLIYRRPRLGTFIKKTDAIYPSPSNFPASEKTSHEIKWLKFHDLHYLQSVNIENAIKKRFESEFHDCSLKIRDINSIDYLLESSREIIESADIYTLTPPALKGFIDKKHLHSLNNYYEDPSESYFSSALKPAKVYGNIYALPRSFHATGLFCNKSIFEEMGIELPDENLSWTQLSSILKSFPVQRNGEKLYRFGYVTYAARFWENFIWQRGGNIFNDSDGTCLIDSKSCVAGIQEAVDFLYSVGVEETLDLSLGPASFLNRDNGRNIACFIGSPGLHLLLGDNPPDEWKVVSLPFSERKISGAEVFYIGLNRSSIHLKEASSLLRLICGDFGQDLLGSNRITLPASIIPATRHFNEPTMNISMKGFIQAAQSEVHLTEDWHYDNFKFYLLQENIRRCISNPLECKEICENTAKIINAYVHNPQRTLKKNNDNQVFKGDFAKEAV